MSNSKLLMAILGGIAAGATIGLLYAPEAGTETRKKIAEPVRSAGKRASDYVDRLVAEGKRTWYKAKGQADDTAGVAAEEMDDFIRHIARKGEKMWKKGKKTARRAGEDVADGVENAVDEGQDFANDMGQEARQAGRDLRREARQAGDDITENFG
jgi:gas vesicle protein